MTRTLMAQKLNGIANSSKNNLNHQDRMFLKQVADELSFLERFGPVLAEHNNVVQNGQNNISMVNAGTMTIEMG